MLRRALVLPRPPEESFFLRGPRQTGKTSLLRATYPDAVWVDLLRTDDMIRYGSRPAFLREELLARPRGTLVVIDEIQKVPALLFEILVDTLLARFLPAYTRRPKRRVIQTPKCYFADVGVVNVLARRGRLEPGSELFGKALESWVFHELSAYRAYHGFAFDLAYWRLASGTEVDFVVDDLRCAVEAKATARVHGDHLKGLRELHRDHPRVGRRVVVSLEARARRTEDGIDVLPASVFARELWSGALLAA